MTEEQGGQAAPDQRDGLNVPDAVEKLVAEMASVLTDLEALRARVAQLEAAGS